MPSYRYNLFLLSIQFSSQILVRYQEGQLVLFDVNLRFILQRENKQHVINNMTHNTSQLENY